MIKKWREFWLYKRFSGERATLDSPIKCDKGNNPSWKPLAHVIEVGALRECEAKLEKAIKALEYYTNSQKAGSYTEMAKITLKEIQGKHNE